MLNPYFKFLFHPFSTRRSIPNLYPVSLGLPSLWRWSPRHWLCGATLDVRRATGRGARTKGPVWKCSPNLEMFDVATRRGFFVQVDYGWLWLTMVDYGWLMNSTVGVSSLAVETTDFTTMLQVSRVSRQLGITQGLYISSNNWATLGSGTLW